MHFKCFRCPNEFCSGCGASFKKAQVHLPTLLVLSCLLISLSLPLSYLQACGRFKSCASRGLHAHHPRDCLYFMRDFSVEELQGFLRENKVEFETEPPQEQLDTVGEEEGESAEATAEQPNAVGEGESIFTSLTTCCDCTTGLIVSIVKKVVLKCSAMLQKETVDELMEEACGDVVKDGHAGLCE